MVRGVYKGNQPIIVASTFFNKRTQFKNIGLRPLFRKRWRAISSAIRTIKSEKQGISIEILILQLRMGMMVPCYPMWI
jgi:hypothetical protein